MQVPRERAVQMKTPCLIIASIVRSVAREYAKCLMSENTSVTIVDWERIATTTRR